MWKRYLPSLPSLRVSSFSYYSSSSAPESKIPILYSFLQPSIFTMKTQPQSPLQDPIKTPPKSSLENPTKASPSQEISNLESSLQTSLSINNTDQAWKYFKHLTSHLSSSSPPPFFPSPHLFNSLISHLSSQKDLLNLKRAFASTVFLLEKHPQCLSMQTIQTVLQSMQSANTPAPAFALLKSLFKNRIFPPFSLWGCILIEISRKNRDFFPAFLRLFDLSCKISLDEKLDFMKPDLAACNAALEGCCIDLGSVSDAEKVVETMSVLGIKPDVMSFGFLAYLYAFKGLEEKVVELEILMGAFGFPSKKLFYGNLIHGYVKSGDLGSVSAVILRALRERTDKDSVLNEECYGEVVKGFFGSGRIKDLAKLIIDGQELESSQSSNSAESTVGFGIVNACIDLGLLDKAHCILDEMSAQGGAVGIGVYSSILKAYCKERRTAEAAQLVMEVNGSGLRLDAGSYDALIDASMSSQDFQSAFSLFREMREARIPDLKMSYLTIMTGLTENHRPELMAAFLDEIVDDPRVEIGTHDWNSIIHAFCKLGRLEDARRTFRRMVFLRFQPNEQTYLSLINGYVTAGSYFSVLILWTEVRKRMSVDGGKGIKFDHNLVDAFLYALVKGGFFDAAMQVVEKAQEMKIFVDKWRHKQAFMETHKKLKVAKLRRRNFRKMEALIAFKNWAGLNV
ncbi:pentatricopeptide repeat-containing protein At1g69290-like [Magnolia sinica]|uniref:pentatricopeptide repeat-containing protein At1g69290-like n=1 Tax=Magnolia sinica TaxID=86752 RepID=UPI00265A7B6B|nr:pentatricopeptide repeat-containing protein At1g69290-like [Magnolia sinica]XP_058081009.1 pentatricopeptide repeat-containing protein At1g69290-like [Magnolia sinica]XP_058081010.1 pentatricopeptide repeat-containing protein At1g69290-like [Magnolia sinica]XP_058081011.1 pentatricopeptide repeat-containing protein At1g69290-like [Magnolia sinica]